VIKKPRKYEEAKTRYRAVENTTTMDCNARKTNSFPQLLSDLADIRSNRPVHNGVVNFVLREAVKFLTGLNVMDILNLKHASKYWVLRHGKHHLQTYCGGVTVTRDVGGVNLLENKGADNIRS
jgi:hypothetical protein